MSDVIYIEKDPKFTASTMIFTQIGILVFATGAAIAILREDREPFVEIRAVKEPPSTPSAPPLSHPDSPSSGQESKVESEEKSGQPNDEEEATEQTAESPLASGTTPEKPADKESFLVLRLLSGDERIVFRSIVDAGGETYQKDIVIGTKLSDAKVSRVLEKLEEKSVIEKERHGMTNVVRIKIE